MIETSVTMSLERFKELESCEKAIQAMNSNEKYYIHKNYSEYFIESSDKASIDMLQRMSRAETERNDIIQKVREYERKTGKTVL